MNTFIQSLFPQTIETRQSDINDNIEVQKFLGRYSVNAGGLTQSGGPVNIIWRKTVNHLKKRYFKTPPSSILILGLGAGSMVEKITKAWPQSPLTGVEIDPTMIDLGNKYFNLSDYQHLNIIKADVFKWVQDNQDKFDLIFTDLYVGKNIPQKSQTKKFANLVKRHLTPRDIAVFNTLALPQQKKTANQFIHILNQTFSHVTKIPTPINWIMLCSE